jgi:hypothetical protein
MRYKTFLDPPFYYTESPVLTKPAHKNVRHPGTQIMHLEASLSSRMASTAIHFPSLYPRDQNSDLLSSRATALISTPGLT